jgi:tRNA dimethylallyltransferase
MASFRNEKAFLSNFYKCKVKYEGLIYPSAENAYQASKTLDMEKRKEFQIITPLEAKRLGRRVVLRNDFEKRKKDLTGWQMDWNTRLSVSIRAETYHLHPYVRNGIRLWLYDIVNPDQSFSVGLYEKLAKRVIQSIHDRGKLPVVVGGSGLYLQSITHGINTSQIAPNEKLRIELSKKPLEDLQNLLLRSAPDIYTSLNESDRRNPRRLIRKIELAYAGEKKLTLHEAVFDTCSIGLTASRDVLYARIDKRVEERISQGAESEVRQLLGMGYSFQLPSMNSMGYEQWREMVENGNEDKNAIISKWKADEHAYAKRQMTWFKKVSGIQWFDIGKQHWDANLRASINAWYNKS